MFLLCTYDYDRNQIDKSKVGRRPTTFLTMEFSFTHKQFEYSRRALNKSKRSTSKLITSCIKTGLADPPAGL